MKRTKMEEHSVKDFKFRSIVLRYTFNERIPLFSY